MEQALESIGGADMVRMFKNEAKFVEEIVNFAESDKKVDRKHAHAMFIGPGDSGKSSLMFRLLGRRKLPSTSTGIAQPVIVVDIHSVTVAGSDTWQEVKFDESLNT